MHMTPPNTNDDISTSTTSSSTTPKSSSDWKQNAVEEEVETEESLSDVDTRVLRAMLQEQKFNMNDEEELRKLLERGTVKTSTNKKKSMFNSNNDDSTEDESLYSSQVLKTLTDTKLWKKLSVQANDILESVSIWVTNKVEQDVKVLAALSVFAWDRVQQDVARALPATSSSSTSSSSNTATNNVLKPNIFLFTNTSSANDMNRRKESSSENVREQLNRPEDEIKSVSRELFAILSGERTRYSSSTGISNRSSRPGSSLPQQRGLRTVAPAGTAYSGERQRRALQQKRKVEQSKKNIATNIGSNVVDSVWELRQEMKAEVNTPGYKTEPIRNVIAASVTATNNLLQGVRERAQLVAAATIRQKDDLLLLEQQQQQQEQGTLEEPIDDTIKVENNVETDQRNAVVSQQETSIIEEAVVDPPMTTPELSLFRGICTERERIMNQLTSCIDVPTESWLTTDIVDTFETMDFITSPGMQNSITKMILLRDEIYKNHFQRSDTTSGTVNSSPDSDIMIQPRSSFDAAVNDLLAIRIAIDYLYNCTVQDVSELVAEEIRYYILFASSSSDTNDVPLILRIEDELLNIEQQNNSDEEIVIDSKNVFVVTDDIDPIRNTATSSTKNKNKSTSPATTSASVISVPDIVDVTPDVVYMDAPSTNWMNDDDNDDKFVDNDADDMTSTRFIAEIVSDDDYDNAASGTTFKQVYDVSNDKEMSDVEQSPNVFLVLVLRSIDVLLFVAEKVFTVGIPGTIAIVTNVWKRIDEMNQLGLGTKGWKELGNVAKAKGRY